jgi:hypothetical protein
MNTAEIITSLEQINALWQSGRVGPANVLFCQLIQQLKDDQDVDADAG